MSAFCARIRLARAKRKDLDCQMEIKVLGAHNTESRNTRYMCLLIDDVLALDAGGLTSSLSFRAQQKIKTILLTHHHYDHVRDIPTIAINFFLRGARINIGGSQPVYDAIFNHLMNKDLYPNFMELPENNPTVKFTLLEPFKPIQIEGYSVLPVQVKHSIPAMGYQVTSPDGKTFFYTGDTGPDIKECWQYISPQVLFIEVTAPNRYEEFAARVGHLTPNLLQRELISFRSLKGYLPQVVTVHMNPMEEKEIASELELLSQTLNCDISMSYEGMRVQL